MPNNAPDVIFFIREEFSDTMQSTLPLERIWALAVEEEVVFVTGT
jgi:hypothetical protein